MRIHPAPAKQTIKIRFETKTCYFWHHQELFFKALVFVQPIMEPESEFDCFFRVENSVEKATDLDTAAGLSILTLDPTEGFLADDIETLTGATVQQDFPGYKLLAPGMEDRYPFHKPVFLGADNLFRSGNVFLGFTRVFGLESAFLGVENAFLRVYYVLGRTDNVFFRAENIRGSPLTQDVSMLWKILSLHTHLRQWLSSTSLLSPAQVHSVGPITLSRSDHSHTQTLGYPGFRESRTCSPIY
jgi:hypothetical protein